jgi:hypothetical protein
MYTLLIKMYAHVIKKEVRQEIRRIVVQSQPRQIVQETLSQKTLHRNRTGGVAQGEGLSSSTSTAEKKKKKKSKPQKTQL